MPSHQDRREPLPKGYQFGDARIYLDGEAMARTTMQAACRSFDQRHSHHLFYQGAPTCLCGTINRVVTYETPDERLRGTAFGGANANLWNVIEGESFASDAERHPITLGFDTYRDPGDEA